MQEIRRFLLKDDVYKEVYGVLTHTLPEKHFEFYIHEGHPDTHYPPFVKEARVREFRIY